MLFSAESHLNLMVIHANESTNNRLKASADLQIAYFRRNMPLLKLVVSLYDMIKI